MRDDGADLLDSELLEPLRAVARKEPLRVALRSGGRRDATFSDVLALVERSHAALQSMGVGPASRVALILPTQPETAAAILAVATLAAAVPINPAYPPDEAVRFLSDAHVSHVIVAAGDERAYSAAKRAGAAVIRLDRDVGGTTAGFTLTGPPAQGGAPADLTNPSRVALVLHTSGSTGSPKRVPLTAAALSQSVRKIGRSLGLGTEDVCLSMMPMFHIGALVDLLLAPLAAGGAVAFADAIGTDACFRAVPVFRPTWFQAVPTVLRDLLDDPRAAREKSHWAGLRFVRAVSQSLPVALQERFEASFGVPLAPMFGMTETAGLITSTPVDGRPRKPGSVGVPFGPRVRVRAADGAPLPAGARGEVEVSGPTVMSGYEDLPAAEQPFRDGWLRTGDEGYFDRDGYLFLTGRLKEVINRGGEKISPSEIDELLASCPGVAAGAAFALPHETLGEEVAAAVVPASGARLTPADVVAALRGRIADYKQPRVVVLVDALPRVPSGKLDRRALPALCGVAAPSARTPPGSPMELLLASFWRNLLKAPDVAVEDNFFDLGGDSLSATTLALSLERRLGSDLPFESLFDDPTLGGMAARLSRFVAAPRSAGALDPAVAEAVLRATISWPAARDGLVLSRNRHGSKRPFFWVCQSNWQFELLADELDPERPFHVLRSLSTTPVKSDANTQALALHYADEIQRLQPEGPYLVGGFCQGAVVAFKIAQELRRRAQDVAILCMQDRFIPEPYDGPAALFHGKRGWFCAYDLHDQPDRAWRRFYSGPIREFFSDGDHDDHHKPPYVAAFGRQLEELFSEVEAASPTHGETDAVTKETADRHRDLRIRARVPTLLRQGQELSLPVALTNRSTTAWPATSENGVILAARWRVLDGNRHDHVLDGRTALEQPIGPGETASLALPVRVPMRSLPMRLEISLVRDGLFWFADANGACFRKLIVSTRPARLRWTAMPAEPG